MNQYAIVQEVYQKLDPARLGPIFQQALGLLRYDAMRLANQARGILLERLDEPKALRAEQALKQAGIEVRRVPQGMIARYARPLIVRQLGFQEDALQLQVGYTDRLEWIAWKEVYLINAGELVEEQVGLPLPPPRRRRGLLLGGGLFGQVAVPASGVVAGREFGSPSGRSDTVQLADLFAGTGGQEFLHVRLRARELRYDRILGKDCRSNYLENFKVVLAALASRSTSAFVGDGLRALVLGEEAGVDPSEKEFGEEEEFTEYNRWQLIMLRVEGHARGPDPGDQAAP